MEDRPSHRISFPVKVWASNWATYHQESERYASLAEEASRKRELKQALKFYQSAAEAEVHALNSLASTKVRTLGITAVSAASLWFKPRNFQQAKILYRNVLVIICYHLLQLNS